MKKVSKEAVTAAFYIVYMLVAYLFYHLFPGNATMPNMGVLLFFLLIPISFIYAAYHLIKHFNSGVNHIQCLLIHAVAWFSIITFLSNFKK